MTTKKKSDVESYQDKLMGQAVGTMKLGAVTTIGSGVIGGLGSMVPGSQPAVSAANTGFTLLNVGNMANIGLGMTKDMGGMVSTPKQQEVKSNDTIDKIKKMLG